jgi:Family of unknown function (DUF5335)
MTTRKLDNRQWRTFFDRVSKTVMGKQAEIEVASLRLGDQVEARWLPLLGMTYDPNDDIVEMALEGLDHLIPKPREIFVEDDAAGLAALEIIDADGVRQIVKLRDPLMLPAPAHMK